MVFSLRAPLAALLAIHCAAAPVPAQTAPPATDASKWSTLVGKLKPDTRRETMLPDDVADRVKRATESPNLVDLRTSLVAVTLRDRRVVSGYIDSMRDHSFFVADPQTGVVTQVAYREVAHLSALSGKARLALTVVVLVGAALAITYMHWLATGD